MASQSSPPPSSAAPSASMKTTALAPGFRFHPTDEELVSYYLKRKVSNKPVRFSAISEVDIYKNEPWDLADKSRLKSRDNEWYFFGALDRKYGNGARMNRATNKGYWKATGKDREVRRGSQIIAMKKTLVFHSGRAPGGQRTNWVMHEYRLVEEELERIGSQINSYVLCRVFHKSNIGPPNGNRYAPFVEEEWDDGDIAFVPGEDAIDDVAAYQENCSERNGADKDNHSINPNPFNINEVPKDSENFEEFQQENLIMCKTERIDDCPPCVLNTEAPFPVLQYKRRKHNNNDIFSNPSKASDNSTRTTTQDRSSSTTSTAATTTTTTIDTTMNATTTAISALLEFSLMESIEQKERPKVPSRKQDGFDLDSSLHSGCSKFINDLQIEVQKVSVEKESLKLELMSAHAMMNILQSRIDFLKKENEDLKRSM